MLWHCLEHKWSFNSTNRQNYILSQSNLNVAALRWKELVVLLMDELRSNARSCLLPFFSPLTFSQEFDSPDNSFLLVCQRLVSQSRTTFQPDFFFFPFYGCLSDSWFKSKEKAGSSVDYKYLYFPLFYFFALMLRLLWYLIFFSSNIFFLSTPATLDQNYIVCELQHKINVLYSFLRSHLKKKSIVFFASCKEVWLFYFTVFSFSL